MMSKRKETEPTEVIVKGGDLDVGGIVKNAKVGSVLRPMQVRKLKASIYDKKTKQSLFDYLVQSGAIAEQPVKPTESPAAGE